MSDEKAKGIALAGVESGSFHVFNGERFAFRGFDFVGETATSNIRHDDDGLYATGTYAMTSKGDTSNLKFGEWIVYHPNGQVRSKGSYGIGKYIQCCAGGPCMMYYDYKLGYWNNYYSSGKLKSSGKYQLYPMEIQTSCEGGAIYLESHRDKEWVFYDVDGKRTNGTVGE